MLLHDPLKGSYKTESLGLSGCPIRLHNIFAGPDGKIYSSAYILRRFGVYDPATGKSTQFAGIKQAEGGTTLGSRFYFGTYPHAEIFTFDTARPVGAGNPRSFASLDKYGQDRPLALVADGQQNKLYIGTVPAYGKLGGAFSIADLATAGIKVFRDVIPRQSVTTLALRDGIVYGGTTIYGGLGIEPTEKEARLFLCDTLTNKKILEIVPVANARTVSGLNWGSDGNLWGWADGTLFVFDPRTRKVIYSEEKFPLEDKSRHYWRGGGATVAAGGKIYGTIFGNVYCLDCATHVVEVLARGPSLEVMARGNDGSLYFTDESVLRRLVLVPTKAQ